VDNVDQLEWMGRFIGRIHAVSSLELFQHRPSFNVDEMLYQAHNVISESGFVPKALQIPSFTILEQVIENNS
jgi:hypothetical protein